MRIVSFISSHKIHKVLHSKYFGFIIFKAKLSSVKGLIPLNIMTGLSIIVVSFPIIFSAGYTAYIDQEIG